MQKKSHSNRGKNLELKIDEMNNYYLIDGIAAVHKIPHPFQLMKTPESYLRRGLRLGFNKKGELVDYIGVYNSIALAFDAKETATKSLPLENIKDHQVKFLREYYLNGAISFILVRFTELDRMFMVGFKQLESYLERSGNGRKSISIKDCEKECIEMESYAYIDYINKIERV